MDLSQYSTTDLKDLLDAIPAELKRREAEARVKLRQEFEALARQHGFSLDELLAGATSGKSAGKARGTVAPKYRNPADASQTWTGRGRQPLWVATFVANGGSLEALLIK
jgi:DNA-binding protein H-NS